MCVYVGVCVCVNSHYAVHLLYTHSGVNNKSGLSYSGQIVLSQHLFYSSVLVRVGQHRLHLLNQSRMACMTSPNCKEISWAIEIKKIKNKINRKCSAFKAAIVDIFTFTLLEDQTLCVFWKRSLIITHFPPNSAVPFSSTDHLASFSSVF